MLPRLVYGPSSSWDRIHLLTWLQLDEWMLGRVLLKLEFYSSSPLLLVVLLVLLRLLVCDVMVDPMTLMM